MKRKILITALCMAMLLSVAVPCFAVVNENNMLPYLDTEKQHTTVRKLTDGTVTAYCFDEYTEDSGHLNIIGNADIYKLAEGNWTFSQSYAVGLVRNTHTILYDSTGILPLAENWVFAPPPKEPLKYTDFSEPIEAFFDQITVGQVVAVLAWIATAVVAFPFLWWGVRKLTRAVMGAFKKGRVNL